MVARDGHTDFRIQLQPPDLGSVAIHLSVNLDHEVAAHIVVSSEATQLLLSSGWPALQHTLAQAGVRLTTFDVSRDGQGSQTSSQQHQQEPGSREFAEAGSGRLRRPQGPSAPNIGQINLLA